MIFLLISLFNPGLESQKMAKRLGWPVNTLMGQYHGEGIPNHIPHGIGPSHLPRRTFIVCREGGR